MNINNYTISFGTHTGPSRKWEHFTARKVKIEDLYLAQIMQQTERGRTRKNGQRKKMPQYLPVIEPKHNLSTIQPKSGTPSSWAKNFILTNLQTQTPPQQLTIPLSRDEIEQMFSARRLKMDGNNHFTYTRMKRVILPRRLHPSLRR